MTISPRNTAEESEDAEEAEGVEVAEARTGLFLGVLCGETGGSAGKLKTSVG
jgi:hypothetical protein